MDVPFDLWGQHGGAGIDVVGEPQYAGTIRDLLGTSFRPGGSELVVTARLVPEPWNQDAVAIRVGERLVGYLPRAEAERYAPALSRLVAGGWSPQVAARVRALSDHRGLIASVWVDLAEPHLIAPVNRPPDGPSRLLPAGAAIPVIIDGTPLPRAAECWFYVTLHELVEPLPRGSRSVLQVRLDGSVIGRLTPRMSAELLPAVRRLAGGHQLTAARARWTATGAAPEMIVYSARSHELPELWLDSIAPEAQSAASLYGSPALYGSPPAESSEPLDDSRPAAASSSLYGSPSTNAPALYGSPAGGSAHWDLIDAGKPAAGSERFGPAAEAHSEMPAGSSDRRGPRSLEDTDGRRRLVPAPRDNRPSPVPGLNGVYSAAATGHAPLRARAGRPEPAARPDDAVPPRPSGVRFATPPGWPAPPPGWTPRPGWRPNPAWPPAPADWQWWVPYWEEPPGRPGR